MLNVKMFCFEAVVRLYFNKVLKKKLKGLTIFHLSDILGKIVYSSAPKHILWFGKYSFGNSRPLNYTPTLEEQIFVAFFRATINHRRLKFEPSFCFACHMVGYYLI